MNLYKIVAWTFLQSLLILSTINAFEVPDFINSVPSGYYAGVSALCTDLQKARLSAISDVVRQILGSINAEYEHSYINKVSGNPNNPQRLIQDDLFKIASGVVLDIDRNIIKASHSLDSYNKYVCFILVRYSDSKIIEMRRLSNGANIVASVLSESKGILRVNVAETNGVSAILSSADIHIFKKNQFAKFINFCIWRVPYGSKKSFCTAINPVKISGSSSIVILNLSQSQKDWKDYLLGAKSNYKIKIKGFDEMGRPVSATIEF